MKTKELINKQIERFEEEIMVLNGCINTLRTMNLIKEIKKLKKLKNGELER